MVVAFIPLCVTAKSRPILVEPQSARKRNGRGKCHEENSAMSASQHRCTRRHTCSVISGCFHGSFLKLRLTLAYK